MVWSRAELIRSTPDIDWFFNESVSNVEWDRYLSFYQLERLSRIKNEVKHYAGLWRFDGHELMVQSWRFSEKGSQKIERETAIIMHGYYDHIGLYGSLIEFCLDRGYNVVAVDLPGHGLSSGIPAHITSFQEYDQVLSHLLTSVGAHPDKPAHLFAQSMGGAIAVNYVLKRRLTATTSPIRHLVLFAPLVRPLRWSRIKILHNLLKRFITQLKRKPSNSSYDEDFLNLINNEDPLQATHVKVSWITALGEWLQYINYQPPSSHPIIVLQGDEEKTVDARFNIPFIAEKLPNHIKLTCKGVRHHMVNEIHSLRSLFYSQLSVILDRRERK